MKIVQKNQLKIIVFTAWKNHCILQRHVFVMHGSCRQKTFFAFAKTKEQFNSVSASFLFVFKYILQKIRTLACIYS